MPVIKHCTSFHSRYCREMYACSYFMVTDDGAYFCDRKKWSCKKNDPPGKMWWCYFEVVLHCIPNRCNKISFKQAICLFKVKINVFHKVVKIIYLGLRGFSHPQCTSQEKNWKLKKKNLQQQCKAPSHLLFTYVICKCFYWEIRYDIYICSIY